MVTMTTCRNQKCAPTYRRLISDPLSNKLQFSKIVFFDFEDTVLIVQHINNLHILHFRSHA